MFAVRDSIQQMFNPERGSPCSRLYPQVEGLFSLARFCLLGLSRLLHLVSGVSRDFEALFGCAGGDSASRLENFGQAFLDIAGRVSAGHLPRFRPTSLPTRPRFRWPFDWIPRSSSPMATPSVVEGIKRYARSRLSRGAFVGLCGFCCSVRIPVSPPASAEPSYISVISPRHLRHDSLEPVKFRLCRVGVQFCSGLVDLAVCVLARRWIPRAGWHEIRAALHGPPPGRRVGARCAPELERSAVLRPAGFRASDRQHGESRGAPCDLHQN